MKEDWIECTLGEVFDFVGGGTPSKKEPEYWNGNIPWASIKDLKSDYLYETKDFITEKGLENSSANIALENDIILATRINPGRPILAKTDVAINQDLKIAIPKIKSQTGYLFFLFRTLEPKILKLSSGTTVLGINLANLKSIKFRLPPIPIQQAIVKKIEALFSSLDSGIADLKKAQDQLKIYRQAVLKKAFEGDWKKMELVKVCEKATKIKRKEMPSDKPLKYIDIGGIDNNLNKIVSHKDYTWENAPSRAQQIVKAGDVLFSTVRTYLKNIARIENPIYENEIASSGFTVIRGKKDVLNSKFIFFITTAQFFLEPLNKLQRGTSYPAVRDNDVFSQKIPVPPLKEQHQIVQEIESRLSVCDAVEQNIKDSLEKAQALRQSILKKAFEGKLLSEEEIAACKAHPDYEPASVLLARIERSRNERIKKKKK